MISLDKFLKHLMKKKRYSLVITSLRLLNLLLAGLFLLSVLAGYIPPSKFPFLSVPGLVFPLLFFANLFFVLLWIVLRKKELLISLVVLLLGFSDINRHFGFSFSGSEAKGKKIKVVSYNVQGFTHSNNLKLRNIKKQEILKFLLDRNPDIVCLQEYHSVDKKLYQPLKDDKQYLNAGTHFFQSYFGPGYKELIGMIIFSKFPSVNSGYLKFDGQRTFAIYTDLNTGEDTVRVINVHLASISLSPRDLDMISKGGIDQENELSRSKRIYYKLVKAYKLHERQMKAILKLAEETKGKVILCGDFNDTPGSFTYGLADRVFSDAFRQDGFGMSPTYAGPIPFLRIDYIMLKGNGMDVISYKRHKVRFSDHYPVSAEIEIEH